MVKYSAILNRNNTIKHISLYFDDVEETDFVNNLDELKKNVNDYLKLKYIDKAGLKLTCVIKRASDTKFALTETVK
jgi:hypothetical protein